VDRVLDYPDLYHEAADSLYQAGLQEDALIFYRALKAVSSQEDADLYLQMGKCYLNGKRNREAEECFQQAITLDQDNIDARVYLAKLYEELNEQEQAFIYVNEIMNLRRLQKSKRRQQQLLEDITQGNDTLMPPLARAKSYYKPKRVINAEERQRQENATAERLQEQYSVMRLERDAMRAGDERSTIAWMEAAADLIDDFRGFKTFYPWDKYVRFLGYTAGPARGQPQTGATPLDADLEEMANRISSSKLLFVKERALF
jgi:general transcription factor 3C polypeptide 3 (transcription factor C subunit 4)